MDYFNSLNKIIKKNERVQNVPEVFESTLRVNWNVLYRFWPLHLRPVLTFLKVIFIMNFLFCQI